MVGWVPHHVNDTAEFLCSGGVGWILDECDFVQLLSWPNKCTSDLWTEREVLRRNLSFVMFNELKAGSCSTTYQGCLLPVGCQARLRFSSCDICKFWSKVGKTSDFCMCIYLQFTKLWLLSKWKNAITANLLLKGRNFKGNLRRWFRVFTNICNSVKALRGQSSMGPVGCIWLQEVSLLITPFWSVAYRAIATFSVFQH